MKTFFKSLPSLLLLVTLVGNSFNSNAQDIRFSKPFSVPLSLNPAMMGTNADLKATLNYRNQWMTIDDGYQTYNFTFMYPIFVNDGKGKLDIGLNAINDRAGAFNSMDISLAVGYSLALTETHHHLSAALLGGFVQKQLDAANLTFDDQYITGSFNSVNATNETVLNEKVGYPDVGFGLLWFYNPPREDSKINAYFGVSAYHLNQPNESFTGLTGKLPIRYSYQTGIKIITEGKLDFTPNLRISSQSGAEEIASGLYLDYHLNDEMILEIGGWYRKRDGIAFLVGFDHDMFSVGYSYDLGMTELNNAVGGLMTHEVTLGFKMDQAAKKDIKFVSPIPLF
ncbi:MAG: PorP/SprF family type IX secretion system membrane protein [Bacteroidia bacterium]|nr:PorP/SprF family type IX secretion system membrane protein [Bacteroidia bacterium]